MKPWATEKRPAGPLLATTKAFLDDLGLRSLAELPALSDLDPTHLLEFPDAPAKAAEAEFSLASPILADPSAVDIDDTSERESDAASDEPAEPAGHTGSLH